MDGFSPCKWLIVVISSYMKHIQQHHIIKGFILTQTLKSGVMHSNPSNPATCPQRGQACEGHATCRWRCVSCCQQREPRTPAGVSARCVTESAASASVSQQETKEGTSDGFSIQDASTVPVPPKAVQGEAQHEEHPYLKTSSKSEYVNALDPI